MNLEDYHRENFIALRSEAMDAYRLVDRVAKEVVQLVNTSGEHRIACRRGCNTCCTVFVRVTFAEAAAIALWLFEPSCTDRLDRVREKIARWRNAVGPEVEMLEVLASRVDIHLDSGSDSQLFADALRTYHRRKLMCPFNADDGSCEIYTFRPVVCRAFFVIDTPENCGLDAYGEVGVVRDARLTNVVLSLKRGLKGASAAVGYGTISALPVGVCRAISALEKMALTVN